MNVLTPRVFLKKGDTFIVTDQLKGFHGPGWVGALTHSEWEKSLVFISLMPRVSSLTGRRLTTDVC